MNKYGVHAVDFVTTTAVKTFIKVTTVTKAPVEIVELAMFGSGTAAPADVAHQATFAFLSAAGAGTAGATPTPAQFSQSLGAAAANSTVGTAYSAEPTTYQSVFPVMMAFNQRGGMRWAVPQGEGLQNQFENTSMHNGWRIKSSAAGQVDGYVNWWER